MKDYEASIICTVFDNEYKFEDNLSIGISHSAEETKALLMHDIFRVMEDFGNGKGEIETARSAYDEVVTIVHTHDADNDGHTMHWHYYCLFNECKEGEQDADSN